MADHDPDGNPRDRIRGPVYLLVLENMKRDNPTATMVMGVVRLPLGQAAYHDDEDVALVSPT